MADDAVGGHDVEQGQAARKRKKGDSVGDERHESLAGKDASPTASRERKKRALITYTFRVHGSKNGQAHILKACSDTTLWALVQKAFESFLEVELVEGISAHLWHLAILENPTSKRKWSGRFSSKDDPELRYERLSYPEETDDEYEDMDDLLDDDTAPIVGSCKSTRLKELMLQTRDVLRLDCDKYACSTTLFFMVTAVSTAALPLPACGSGPQYVGPEAVPKGCAPIVSAEEAAENAAFRKKYDAYMQGENRWSWTHGCHLRPEAQRWSALETNTIGSLIRAGFPFTRAWEDLLEPCLLLRTKASTSGFWYKQAKIWGPPRQRAKKDSAFSESLKAEVRACRAEALAWASKFEKDVPVLDPLSCRIVFHHMFLSTMMHRTDEELKSAENAFAAIPMAEKVQFYVDRFVRKW